MIQTPSRLNYSLSKPSALAKLSVLDQYLQIQLCNMAVTRTRSEEDSRVPTNQSVAEGSASAIVPRPTRTRKRNRTNTTLIEPPAETEQSVQPGETDVDPPNRRGPSLNLSITKTLQNMPEGSKLPLTMSTGTKGFVGTSSTTFATECGIIIRNFCPMNYHTWDTIPASAKNLFYEKLGGKFELLRTNDTFMGYVDARLRECWKRYRGVLSDHWKKNGGKTNPKLARKKIKPHCREESWKHMCDYWEMEKTRKYSEQMEANRGKQVHVSRGGSRSIANHILDMTNPETQMPPSPLALYHKLHYNAAKEGWLNDEARVEYEKIVQHKQAAMDELNSEGTIITRAKEQELEKEAIEAVCGKKKTKQSAWEVGVGPVLRKKDAWMKSVAESSQRESSEKQELKNKVIELEAKQKQDKEKYDKIFEFMRGKFPDFESTIATELADEEDHNNTI